MSIAALILAAGRGSRMGRPKQLLELEGRPLVQHVVDAAAAAGLDPVVLVLGHAADEVAAAVRLPPGAAIAVNPDYAQGQATSLRAGLDVMPATARGAVILLGDQPEVRADAIRALVDAHSRGAGPILRAAYGGRASHPVLLDRAVWPEARGLRGDAGARALIAARGVELVEVGGRAPEDIDTPEDHARLIDRRTPGGEVGASGSP